MPLASFMIQVAFLFTNNYKLSFIGGYCHSDGFLPYLQ